MDVHASAHYQWEGATPYQLDGPALQGKLRTALNSYCVNILGNWGACGACHVGRGAPPQPAATQGQLENIDCLICHQERYKRRKDASGLFVPDTANMTITMDQAVQSVHKPTRATCLQCHAKGGGGDNYKRGDLAIAHGATSDRAFDVHMATTGANLTCQRCHTVSEHRIAGRGSDLRQTDLDVTMSCASSRCHRNKVTGGHSSSALNSHVARVACQTCHITAFARNAADTAATEATEMHRDWAQPHVTASGAIHPLPTLVNDVRPVYRFWNRFSDNYSLGEVAVADPETGGRYPTSRPAGSITDTSPANKLYPFKYKTADQPFATLRSLLIPVDTRVYFASGDLLAATASGLANIGLPTTEPWSMVRTDAFQLITHEVQPRSAALTCNRCHGPAATQMNLPSLGYTLKESMTTLCVRCHGRKSDEYGWQKIHDKHVKDKKFDCSHCHAFSRPERGLR